MPNDFLSEEAQNDLREIQRYTQENWGKQKAKRYFIELTTCFVKLAHTPKMGRSREEIAKGIRSFQAIQHIMFYREGRKGIEIARVLHPSMDLSTRFERKKKQEKN